MGSSFVSALGKSFHNRCFVCSQCRRVLGSSTFVEKDGAVFCTECKNPSATHQGLCAGCDLPLGSGRILTACGSKYHPHCLVCARCRGPLPSLTSFIIFDNKPLCGEACAIALATGDVSRPVSVLSATPIAGGGGEGQSSSNALDSLLNDLSQPAGGGDTGGAPAQQPASQQGSELDGLLEQLDGTENRDRSESSALDMLMARLDGGTGDAQSAPASQPAAAAQPASTTSGSALDDLLGELETEPAAGAAAQPQPVAAQPQPARNHTESEAFDMDDLLAELEPEAAGGGQSQAADIGGGVTQSELDDLDALLTQLT
ncbi:uncharacterized protein AMSG_00923 [Thecamonas trahens ATCC 50062]|uniref:LIM zinc-binding domain-containing protein n=1 Tax=Thecamonas trahens ATCC 50062 TaxID=461836 RepID=A0A0L0DIS1_THETB|nr:hypothetical protein AMSG_00923 [Thecamonas trahens ATCC 50062]KNC52095.1 hypothetical protein AMSG_00923 [Thecamonas trahens ATCC 50062]|eukprot:XP_013762100.1 hypothetical protein AMSG_00923 [Thecamonas trahens ATCC 50062]